MKFVLSGSFTPVAHLPGLAIAADRSVRDENQASGETSIP
jgi:hypothetical protein